MIDMLRLKRIMLLLLVIYTITCIKSKPELLAAEQPLERYALPNGLTVVLKENHFAPVVAFNMWVKTGSVNESEKEAGMSHVLEHMLFKGTEKRGVGEIAKEVESSGGDINAYTTYEDTVFHIVLASRFLDAGLDIIADAIQNSKLDPTELWRELEVVVEEIKRGKDIPERKLGEDLFAAAYKVHPYGRPIIGTEETVRNFTRDDVTAYYKRWYVPGNMVLVIVGDFDTESLKPKIEEAFAQFKPQEPPQLSIPQEPPQQETRSLVLREDVSQASMELAYHIPSLTHPDTFALDLLSVIMGQGESSRLYRKVKAESNLVTSISSYAYGMRDSGLFMVHTTLEPKNLEEAMKETFAETIRLQNEPVSEEELAKAKTIVESEFIYDKETVEGEAGNLGYYETATGDIRYEERYLKGIESATPEDIMRVASKYLRPENLTAAAMLPRDALPSLDEAGVKEMVKEASAAAARSAGGEEVKEVTLENGIRLLIKENHAVPIFAVKAAFLGGLRFENEGNNGINNFIAAMLTKGTETRTAYELAQEIESMAASVDGFSGKNSFGLSAGGLSKNFDKILEIAADIVIRPSFDQEEMEKKRKDIIAAIKKQQDRISTVAFRLFAETLYQRHPYRMDTLGTEESVGRLTRQDLISYYRTYAVPRNMVLTVVGDVEADRVIREVSRTFGDMPRKELILPDLLAEPARSSIIENVKNKEGNQAHILLGFLGTTVTAEDRFALQVLNAVLSGQGGRLFIELRDKESLAYSVTSIDHEGMDPGFFTVYMACSPEKVDAAISGIKRELKRIVEEPISQEELDRAKKNIVGSFEIELQQNSAQAGWLAFNELYAVGLESVKEHAEKILGVTAEDVSKVAQKYINLDAYALAMVMPGREG